MREVNVDQALARAYAQRSAAEHSAVPPVPHFEVEVEAEVEAEPRPEAQHSSGRRRCGPWSESSASGSRGWPTS